MQEELELTSYTAVFRVKFLNTFTSTLKLFGNSRIKAIRTFNESFDFTYSFEVMLSREELLHMRLMFKKGDLELFPTAVEFQNHYGYALDEDSL